MVPAPRAARRRHLNCDWFGIGGGDGFQSVVDPTDPNIVYFELQYGKTNRYDLRGGGQRSIRPVGAGWPGWRWRRGGGGGGRGGAAAADVVEARQVENRWNWNTPFMLSPHNPSTVWMGGNRFFRSDNRGDLWTASKDLTRDRSLQGLR